MIDTFNCTRKDLLSLPYRPHGCTSIYDSILVIPEKRLHDSGYSCITVIGVRNKQPIHILTKCSDVIHMKGDSWNMDCLPKSKVMQIFNFDSKIFVGPASSSLYLEKYTSLEKSA